MDTTQKYWQSKARLVAWRWNFAAWLNLFLRFALVASFVMMCALLVVRRQEGPVQMAWWVFGGVLALGAIACLFFARKKFCSRRDALVRLDATLKLHNRLTSATDGVGDWPQEASAATPDGLRWRWQRIVVPPLASLAVLVFAANVRIPTDKADDQHHKEEPLAWTRVDAELETLKKQDIVNEESVVTLQEQVEQLRKQTPGDWYSHSSLEASDNLQAKTDDAIRSLQRDMESVLNTLNAAEQNADGMNSDQLQKLGAQFEQPLQGLELGTLPLNKDLINQLKNIDPNRLNNISQLQMNQLKQALQKGISGCKACFNPGDNADAALLALMQTGAGGKGGGGGPAPFGYKPDQTNLGTKTNQQIANDDLSHAAAGDLVGVSKGQHQVDPTKYSGPASAGGIGSTGAGGEAVWKNQLTPQEREILERFYK